MSHPSLRPVSPWWASALLLLPVAGAAQAPGYRGPDARQLRAEYRAEIIGQVGDALDEWGTAWAEDDLEALAEIYMEEAVVFPPDGDFHRGREAVMGWLREVLPSLGTADAYLQDLEASGGLAAVQTNYRIQGDGGSEPELTGTLFTLFVQQGRHWRIRSQVFRPLPGGDTPLP